MKAPWLCSNRKPTWKHGVSTFNSTFRFSEMTESMPTQLPPSTSEGVTCPVSCQSWSKEKIQQKNRSNGQTYFVQVEHVAFAPKKWQNIIDDAVYCIGFRLYSQIVSCNLICCKWLYFFVFIPATKLAHPLNCKFRKTKKINLTMITNDDSKSC